MCSEGCNKTSGKYGENKMANSAHKKSTTRNTARLNQPITRHIFDVKLPAKNIGTGTVDYWLWMMDQKLRAAFGQYIEG